MITENKLRILTNNPKGNRSREEVIKRRQLIKNICAITYSNASNQIIIHFNMNVEESDWQIESTYKKIVFETIIRVYYNLTNEQLVCFELVNVKDLSGFVSSSEIKRQGRNSMPVQEKSLRMLLLPMRQAGPEITTNQVDSMSFSIENFMKTGIISESQNSRVYVVKHNINPTTKYILKQIVLFNSKASSELIHSVYDDTFKIKHTKTCPFLMPIFYTSGED